MFATGCDMCDGLQQVCGRVGTVATVERWCAADRENDFVRILSMSCSVEPFAMPWLPNLLWFCCSLREYLPRGATVAH